MTKPTRVVLVGHVCIDVNISEGSSYTGWGSALMYMARYFARQQPDVKPVLVSPYGRDFLPYATGLALLPSEPQAGHTLVYKNRSLNGRRTQRSEYYDTAGPVSLTDDIVNHLKQADIICLAPLLPNFSPTYVREILSHKKLGCKTCLLPQGYFRDIRADGQVEPREFREAEEIIPLFGMVIFSEDDHPDSSRSAKRWANLSNIVMTRGPRGAAWIKPDRVVEVPVEPVTEDRIIDSVGCGDTFSAAAMYAYYREDDMAAAIQAGNAAARAKLFQTSY